MESSTFVLLSGALTFGAPILCAVHELVSLRRDRGGSGRPGERRPGSAVPPGPRGGVQEPTRPLPACLIEAAKGAPLPARQAERELEPA